MDKGDDEFNLKEYDYPNRQHQKQPQDSIQQVLYSRRKYYCYHQNAK